MAEFKPYKILSTQLDSLSITEGQFILTTDTNTLYADISATERVIVNSDFILNSLKNYYSKDELIPITPTRVEELWDNTIAQSVI